jgi:AcrR family transcriptional regulator
VSHTAPARHFANRQELLDAVAIEGFAMLAAKMHDAVASAADVRGKARHVARTYVVFVTESASLADVMFRHEAGRESAAVGRSADQAFEPLLQLFDRAAEEGLVRGTDARIAATLFLCTVQGIAALVGCGVLPPAAVDGFIDDAVPRFIG